MKKLVLTVNPFTDVKTLDAEFELVGAEVRAKYNNPAARSMFEELGLCVAGHKKIVPSDGKIFWDNLNRAFTGSTCTIVRDEP